MESEFVPGHFEKAKEILNKEMEDENIWSENIEKSILKRAS